VRVDADEATAANAQAFAAAWSDSLDVMRHRQRRMPEA
jgi:hypothetical protein